MLTTQMKLKCGATAELRMLNMHTLVAGPTEIADGVLADLLMVIMDGRYTDNPGQRFATNKRWLRGAYDLVGRIAFVPGTDTPLLSTNGHAQKGQITAADLHLGELDSLVGWFRYGDTPGVPAAETGQSGGDPAALSGEDLPG